MVRRKNGSVSIRPVRGSTRRSSWCSHPAWFSSDPRWWSTVNSTVPSLAGRGAEVDRGLPAVRPDLEQRARAAAAARPASWSARPSSSGMKPTAARAAASRDASIHGSLAPVPPAPGTLPPDGWNRETQAPDRNLAMELVRVTEAAALAAGRWLGKGDKNGADGAAVDAMRIILNSVSMEGVVVIGEGEKDEAPMLFNGEEIGAGGPACDIAVDPIDGTTLTSLGSQQRDLGDRDLRAGHDVRPRPVRLHGQDRGGPGGGRRHRPRRAGQGQPRSGGQGAGRGRRRHHRGDPRSSPPRGHHPAVPGSRRPHQAHPGRRRRRRHLGRHARAAAPTSSSASVARRKV